MALTPKQAMYAALAADPGVSGVVGARIYPDQAKEGDADYLTFQVVSDTSPKTMRGTAAIRFVRFQLTGEFSRRGSADALLDALYALLRNKVGATFGGLIVKSSTTSGGTSGDDEAGAADEDLAPRPGEESGNRVVRLDVVWAV